MRLFAALSTNSVRHIVAHDFTGITRIIGGKEYVMFRDLPPAGLTRSLTTEAETTQTGENESKVVFSGGPMLADDMGEFQVSIDVPEQVAREHVVTEDPPMGWPFREFWLPPELANAYRSTLMVLIPEGPDEEVPLELFGRAHGVVVTERFAIDDDPDSPAAPVGARCVCGDDWRWDTSGDPRDQFPEWLASHEGGGDS